MKQFKDAANLNETNAIITLINTIINSRSKVGLGLVKNVDKTAKTVDILPLSSGKDKDGNEIIQPEIYKIPYFRYQSGASAVILDPVAGDIGVFACCDKDVSRVISTKKSGIPATDRRDSKSDAVYFGSIIGITPNQYVKFSDSGIDIVTENKINVTCSNITINAKTQAEIIAPSIILNGNIQQISSDTGASASFSSPILAPQVTAGGIPVKGHKHGGVQLGNSDTGEMK